jgi:2,3-bisphosphoglycerate-independent phosphoglycerate mutase
MIRPYPLVALVILDGWGLAPAGPGNAVSLADTPVFDRLQAVFPTTQLVAHGRAVGLPAGTMGNSEVGHLNLGAGQTVWQDLSRIDCSIEEGRWFENAVLCAALRAPRVHLLVLASDGKVHSSLGHIEAAIALAARCGLRGDQLLLHAFTDGRDTSPKSSIGYLERIAQVCQEQGVGRLATLVGRYFAMDRDQRWERTARAVAALVNGQGEQAADPLVALRSAHARGETDEFIEPIIVPGTARIQPGDACLFLNFRADRTRQLCRALTGMELGPGGEVVDRQALSTGVRMTTLTAYDETFPFPVAFPRAAASQTLGDLVAAAGLPQLRMAETEKYAHVTYFFDGGREQRLPGEERVLIPSPRVATYDRCPAMSAVELTDAALERLARGQRGLLVLNYANPDMVGHTGVLAAAIEACATVDTQLGRLLVGIANCGGAAIVTADHGNAELMIDPQTGGPHTAHTTNPVPLIMVAPGLEGVTLASGAALSAVAPTLLTLLGITPPPTMVAGLLPEHNSSSQRGH